MSRERDYLTKNDLTAMVWILLTQDSKSKAALRLEFKYSPRFVQFVLHQVAPRAFAALVLILVVALTLYVIVPL